MKDQKQSLIETDILIGHLTAESNSKYSILETAMSKGICFTTVINSAELFFAAYDNYEKDEVNKLMRALIVLGLNSRYSLNISDFFNKVASVRDALICSVAKKTTSRYLPGKLRSIKTAD